MRRVQRKVQDRFVTKKENLFLLTAEGLGPDLTRPFLAVHSRCIHKALLITSQAFIRVYRYRAPLLSTAIYKIFGLESIFFY